MKLQAIARQRAATVVAAAALLSSAPFPTPLRADVPLYQIIDIGTLGGESTSSSDINDAGQITGDSQLPDGSFHAFLYTDGEMTDLGALDGSSSYANALNENGEVTGFAATADGTHAFLYSDGRMIDLGTIGGTFSRGNDINDSGQVTGIATTADDAYRPFLYTDGEMRDLGTLGDRYATALSINDAGEVAGYYESRFRTHAFAYGDGALLDLASASVESYVEPYAQSINSSGHVTGVYRPAGTNRAFLYRAGGLVDLGTLGGEFSRGIAVNDASEVTGSASTADGESHAFLYSGGMMHDLGALGGRFSIGYAVNGSGDVAGNWAPVGGGLRAFVYTDGRMVDLDLGAFDALEATATDVNDAGQVTGTYTVLADQNRVDARTYLATPISLLLSRLLDSATGVGPGGSLASKVRQAIRRYEDADRDGTCAVLRAFAQQARAQSGTKHLAPETADELRAAAGSVRDALGC